MVLLCLWQILFFLTCFSPSFVHPLEPSTYHCSNVSIPYPFGVAGKSPFLSRGFKVLCGSSGPLLPIGNSVLGILDISLLDGLVSILASANFQQCRGKNSSVNLEGTIFTFSDTRNKFTALGCNVVAMLLNGSTGYSGGCASFCSSNNSIIDGSCSGVACCQAPVPKGLKKLDLEFSNITNKGSDFSLCGEAFIVEQNSYVFSSLDLNNTNNPRPQYRPVVLKWSINGSSCEEAKLFRSYACRENTYCYNSSNGIGYRCNCSHGFEGNPYLQGPDGCQPWLSP